MTDIEKILASYCNNLNRIIQYLKGRQTDLKDIEDLEISESHFSNRVSEINIDLEMLRNVERIKGSEILAGIKNRAPEDFLDATTFSKSLMRESLMSNALRRNKEELLNELEELQHLHQNEAEPMGKFLDVINCKLDPSGSSKDSRVYDLKSFAESRISTTSLMEDSIEMLLIKRLASLEAHLPAQAAEQFKLAKHTLGTVMIDYVNKIEQLDMFVLSTKEQNESLKQKMEDLMKEVRNRRKMEGLGQERYLHLTELLSRQQEVAQREIKLLQEKLEQARSHAGPNVHELTDLQTDYEIVESKDGVEYFIMYPGESADAGFRNVSASLQDSLGIVVHKPDDEKIGFESYIEGDQQYSEGSNLLNPSSKNYKIEPSPMGSPGDESLRGRTPTQVPPTAPEGMESNEEGVTYRDIPREFGQSHHQRYMALPRRLDTIQSENEYMEETPRDAQSRLVGSQQKFMESPNRTISGQGSASEVKKQSIARDKKQSVRLTPEQLLVRMKQLERERTQGVYLIHKLDSIIRRLQQENQESGNKLKKLEKREADLISSYNNFYDNNKNLVRDMEVSEATLLKKQDQMLTELGQLKKADKTTISQLQNSLNTAKMQLERATDNLKYYRDQCILKDAELRRLFEMSEEQPVSSKDFLNLQRSDDMRETTSNVYRDNKRNSPDRSKLVKERDYDDRRDWAKSEWIDTENPEKKEKKEKRKDKRDSPDRNREDQSKTSPNTQRSDINLSHLEQTIDGLRDQVRTLKKEKSKLEDENLKLGNKCAAFDSVLESMTRNKDNELPYIYIKGKPRTGEEILSILNTNDQLVKKKDDEIEKLQKNLSKLEVSYEDLERRFRRVQAGNSQIQGQGKISPGSKQQGNQMQNPAAGQFQTQGGNRSNQTQRTTESGQIRGFFPPQPSEGEEREIHHGTLHRLDSHSAAYYPPHPQEGMERLDENSTRMVAQSRERIQGQYPILPEEGEMYSSEQRYEYSHIPDQYPVLPEEGEQFSSEQRYLPARVPGQYPIPPEGSEQFPAHPERHHLDTHSSPFLPPEGAFSSQLSPIHPLPKTLQQGSGVSLQRQITADQSKLAGLESKIKELTAEKKTIETDKIKLQENLAQLEALRERMQRDIRAYQARSETLEIRLTASEERNLNLEGELGFVRKEIEGLRVINAQVVEESERKQKDHINLSSPINRARASLANHPDASEVTLLDEDSIEELVITVGRENEELKDKIKKLETNNLRLIQERELNISTLKGKEAKITELTSEVNSKESLLKNLKDQHTKVMSQAADSAQVPSSPKTTSTIGIDAQPIESNDEELDRLRKSLFEKDDLIAELKLTIDELKEDLEEKEKALESVRKTLAGVYAKKQYLVNLVLSVKDNFFIEGQPIRSLNEDSLDKMLEEVMQRKSAMSRPGIGVPSKNVLNVINVKAPVLNHETILESESGQPRSTANVGQLNEEVMRLGLDNSRLQQSLLKYLEREESLKGKIIGIIDHNMSLDPDDRQFYEDMKKGIDILDDETIEEYMTPLDYEKLFEFLDFLNKTKTKQTHPFEADKSNQDVFNYEDPQDYNREDDLLMQVLKRNEECQRQIQELLAEKVKQNKSIILRAPSSNWSEANPRAAKKDEQQKEHLQKVTQTLEEFVKH